MTFEHDLNANATQQDEIAADLADTTDASDEAVEAVEAAAETTGTSFSTLGLHDALLRAVKDSGYEYATEVQALAIPPALTGADLMVSSRTGSGKTASFILPALQQVLNAREAAKGAKAPRVQGPRVLVLAPTRELAQQVAKSASTYGRHIQGLRVATVLGGMPYAQQLRMLSGPLDILIATPGRLLDHINSGKCKLDSVTMFVLDEADRMLDMGFIEDIEFVAQTLPAERQTLMYSATFAGNTGRLASQLMKDPQRIAVSGHTETHENIEQRLHWADNGMHKRKLLEHILAERELDQAVVFTSTQHDAEWLAGQLAEIGHRVAALHGGMPQGKRNRTLMALRRRDLRVLVATDVAARGIDVPTISHVINFGLPMKAEDYVHRIGRTGRAGRSGLAVTLAERQDLMMIKRIQQFTTQPIPVARITGLEPRSEEPRIFPPRPGGDRGDRGGDRGGFRGNDRFHGGGQGRGRFDSRGPRPEFRGGDNRFDNSARFEGRPQNRFEGNRPEGGNRFEGNRPEGGNRFEGNRFEGRPARPEGAPRFEQQRPSFGNRDGFPARGGFDAQRPQQRDGGFEQRRGFEPRGQGHGAPGFGGKPAGRGFDRAPEFRGGENRFDNNKPRFEGRPAKPEGARTWGPKPAHDRDGSQDRGGFQARKPGPRKGY